MLMWINYPAFIPENGCFMFDAVHGCHHNGSSGFGCHMVRFNVTNFLIPAGSGFQKCIASPG